MFLMGFTISKEPLTFFDFPANHDNPKPEEIIVDIYRYCATKRQIVLLIREIENAMEMVHKRSIAFSIITDRLPIGGVIYSFTNNVDIDFGAKYALNASETGISLMAGIAFRF